MSEYETRFSAPSEGNKFYTHKSKGGLNKGLHLGDGKVLPNCVAYCLGRWHELLGKDTNLISQNAEDFYAYTKDGYKRSQTPKLFAIACWKKGKLWTESDGAGHVAVVEQVKANGDIICSESHWGGVRWRTKTYTKSTNYYLGSGYEFLGFILFPIDVENENKVEEKLYTTGDYRVTAASLLHVRTGPSTDYSKKKYSEFTKNAREQIYELVRYKADGYVMGVEFTVSKVDGHWGKTPSGWVCLDYCTKI